MAKRLTDQELINVFGDPGAIVEMLRRLRMNVDFLASNDSRWSTEYAGQWVVLNAGRLKGSASDARQLLELVGQWPPEDELVYYFPNPHEYFSSYSDR